MEKMRLDTKAEFTLRSLSMAGADGAIMDEAIGVMNVIRETSPVAIHRLLKGQFLGFSGSPGPFHITLYQSKEPSVSTRLLVFASF
jgi:hypothetical protein